MAATENNSSVIAGKALDRYFDFNKAQFEFHKLFNLENRDERAIAIIGATFLETALEHLLYAFFPEDDKEVANLFEYNQPLGSFSNKISLSYCLGLIDKMIKDDLNIVRKIRNRFAHDLYASFEDEQIKSWSKNLKFHRVSMMMDAPSDATALQVFQVGVNQVISHLSGCIGISRGEKRTIKNVFGEFLNSK